MTQKQALTILKTGKSVFLTGEPGAGKSFTVNEYVHYLEDHGVLPAITASTGIAATHIGGMTIHSWSGIGISSYLSGKDLERIFQNSKLYKRIYETKVLLIDEISMLSGQTLSLVDLVCKTIKESELPFGGIQVVLVGDFFQLPPVSRDEKVQFAYESQAWIDLNPEACYLTEQHRQEDQEFLSLLKAMRKNILEKEHISHLEKRLCIDLPLDENLTKLYSHNNNVDRINHEKLDGIDEPCKIFMMESTGKSHLVESLKKSCLSPEELRLKKGASVMFTKNNPKEGYVNGSLGVVVGFDNKDGLPIVRLKSGNLAYPEPDDWAIEENGKILAKITQIPLRLAWAITIHKSQGMSLDAAVIDLRQVFEFGQGYVALSRVRSLSGLHLLGYNENSLLVHPEVLLKDCDFRNQSGNAYLELSSLSDEDINEMANNFILSIGGSLEKIGKIKKEKISTQMETKKLLAEAKTIKEIAEGRSLSESTIITHFEKLLKNGDIEFADIEKFIPKNVIKDASKIQKTFIKAEDKLTPVYKNLKGKYSYDELKLAKLVTL